MNFLKKKNFLFEDKEKIGLYMQQKILRTNRKGQRMLLPPILKAYKLTTNQKNNKVCLVHSPKNETTFIRPPHNFLFHIFGTS